MAWPDGARYEGGFHRGQLHGQGDMTGTDGTRYVGGFSYGMYHGQGVYSDMSENRYEGDWRKGVFNGGVYTAPDGRRVPCSSGETCPELPWGLQ